MNFLARSTSAASADLLSVSSLAPVLDNASLTPSGVGLNRASQSLLFIDGGVQDYSQLVAGVAPGTEVHILNPVQDAVTQITQALLGREGISSLHIVSHGESGGLDFGGSRLNLTDLPGYAAQLQRWGQALTADADILLYGCDVAQGEVGKAFVNVLSQLTGADVAASDDLTGSSVLGGDWALEYQTGRIEAGLGFAPTAMEGYGKVLDATFAAIQQFTGNNGGSSVTPLKVVIDSSGNVYATGVFQGTADFDPGAGTANLTSVGDTDIFVSKLDSSGNYVWAKGLGGTDFDIANGISVDSSGNVYTTGYFNGTADFDPGAGTANLTSVGGNNDIFVSKLDSSGNYVWAKGLGGTSGDFANDISVDSSGNVYTTGYFTGTADFDPGATAANLTSVGGADIFVSKLDSSGNYVWAKGMGGTSGDFANGISVDSSGNVYTTGYFIGTADFDPSATAANLTSGGNADIFVSKLDSSGNYVWAKGLGGTSGDFAYGISVDSSGNVYTTGYFTGTADFDPGAGTADLTSEGNNDIFVSKLDSSGNYVWAKGMGGTSFDIATGISVDSSGNVYTTGYFQGTADFDPGAGVVNQTAVGSPDGFLSKLSQNLAPTVTVAAAALSYTENAAATLIDPSATVSDTDSLNFDTGTLTVDYSAGGSVDDRLAIQNQGTAAGQIGVSGSTVTFGGVAIGTFTGGTGTTALVITFNTSATPTAISALLQNLTYANVSDTPSTTARTVQFVITDGDGGTSTAVTKTINVTAVNDAPLNTVPTTQTLNEDTSLVFSTANGNAIAIGDVDAGSSPVQVALTATNGTLTLSGIAGLSFTVGDGTSDSTMTFTGTIGSINTALNGLSFTPTANYNGAATLQITTNDQGNSGIGGFLTDSDTINLTIAAINDAPSFTATNPATSLEDAGLQTLTSWASFNSGNAAESAQPATYTVSNLSNAALFTVAPTIAANGTLTYTAAPDANGTATFEVTVRDNGGTANGGVDTSTTQTFTLTVNSVNDRPSVTPGANQSITAGAGAQTVANFASFNPGTTNEAGQTATYTIVANSNPGLFSGQPTIAPDGTLIYTPVASLTSSQTATLTVQVQDSGGTANGGIDTSTTQTFTITVNPIVPPPVTPPIVPPPVTPPIVVPPVTPPIVPPSGVTAIFTVFQLQQTFTLNLATQKLLAAQPSPTLQQLFDEEFYLRQNSDVSAACARGVFQSGFQHFLQYGQYEGRNPSSLFNEQFYLSQNADVAAAVSRGSFRTGFQHFLSFGQFEGRNFCTAYNEQTYLAQNSDVAIAVSRGSFRSGFQHFLSFGFAEGRLPNLTLFNESYYLRQNPDVAAAVAWGVFKSGLQHFEQFGQREGRQPSTLFNERYYLSQNPDVAAAVAQGQFKSGFDHFLDFGRFEGRRGIG